MTTKIQQLYKKGQDSSNEAESLQVGCTVSETNNRIRQM